MPSQSYVFETQRLAQHNAMVGEWTAYHAPAVNTKATSVKAAPGVGLQHVISSISFNLASGTTAPAAAAVTVSLIEDAAGTPATIWALPVTIEATAGKNNLFSVNCQIEVTANKSITLEFSGAGGANTFEGVAMTGYIKNVGPTTTAAGVF